MDFDKSTGVWQDYMVEYYGEIHRRRCGMWDARQTWGTDALMIREIIDELECRRLETPRRAGE
jgi:hypothetical protein